MSGLIGCFGVQMHKLGTVVNELPRPVNRKRHVCSQIVTRAGINLGHVQQLHKTAVQPCAGHRAAGNANLLKKSRYLAAHPWPFGGQHVDWLASCGNPRRICRVGVKCMMDSQQKLVGA